MYDADLVVGVQDLGAAGLSCATSEPAGRAGVGMEVDLDAVHTREAGMTAPELLMSESQERMMAFVHPEKVMDVLEVARKWEIDASVVGEVRSGGTLRISHSGEVVAEVPAATLADNAPLYDRPTRRPDWLDALHARSQPDISEVEPADLLLRLLDDPAVASSRWISEQYDHMLFLNTIVGPGSDGTLIRVRGTEKGLAVSTDGNGFLCLLDPRIGAERLVWEAALNVAVTGAKPMALVDNLNFGNPEKPEVMWQFVESIEGMSAACESLGIPVVGGNVSFYNETDGVDINPTPVVGLLGLADPMPSDPPRLSRAEEGMELWLIGPEASGNLAGTYTQRIVSGQPGGKPTPADSQLGSQSIEAALRLAHVAPVLHDISDGGLAVAVAEIAISSGVGVRVDTAADELFSEDPHRFLCATSADAAAQLGIPGRKIGEFAGDEIILDGTGVALPLASETYSSALPRRMG
jgi:phosphoribosylformylglycinamidine synthase